MRHSTAKILLSLFKPELSQMTLIPVSRLNLLVPELTKRGYDSLLSLLKQRGWINVVGLSNVNYIQLTQSGWEAISGQFPALVMEKQLEPSQWCLVLFSQPPKGDPSFRYLRRLLLSSGAINLGRGQYGFYQDIPSEVNQVLQQLYSNSVYVCRVSKWLAGFISPRIVEQKLQSDWLSISSGLSNQADTLLTKINDKNRLTVNDKKTIASLFEQLVYLLKESRLMDWPEFTQVNGPVQILSKLQQVLML